MRPREIPENVRERLDKEITRVIAAIQEEINNKTILEKAKQIDAGDVIASALMLGGSLFIGGLATNTPPEAAGYGLGVSIGLFIGSFTVIGSRLFDFQSNPMTSLSNILSDAVKLSDELHEFDLMPKVDVNTPIKEFIKALKLTHAGHIRSVDPQLTMRLRENEQRRLKGLRSDLQKLGIFQGQPLTPNTIETPEGTVVLK